uniref:Uncharacterized protein n=1 Tax=Rhizophora mucronata TaxID=61149 RepID=A0A2P2QXT7_RHIMU
MHCVIRQRKLQLKLKFLKLILSCENDCRNNHNY